MNMLDETDFKILELLVKNSRIQWREIGEIVHLTGQAVANRIHKMEDMGIIQGYTVKLDDSKLGKTITAFITVFLKSSDEHIHFQKFIKANDLIEEVHKVSGDGCYLVKANVSNHEELNQLIDKILQYGNYRMNISIGVIK